MAQIQKHGNKKIVKKRDLFILGSASLYSMYVIASFSSDTVTVSRGKSYILAKFCENIIRKLTAPFFSYNREAFTSVLMNLIRKCAHAFEFFLLASLLLAFTRTLTGKIKQKFVALMSIFFAFSDELHQAFVPGRGPMLSDVAVDTVGVILAVVILSHFFRKNTHNII